MTARLEFVFTSVRGLMSVFLHLFLKLRVGAWPSFAISTRRADYSSCGNSNAAPRQCHRAAARHHLGWPAGLRVRLARGPLARFETCPDWVPAMDTGQRFARITLKTIRVHGFDHIANWPAKVRNVSRLGSQSFKDLPARSEVSTPQNPTLRYIFVSFGVDKDFDNLAVGVLLRAQRGVAINIHGGGHIAMAA